MKKHTFILFAAAAVMACSKLAPTDDIPATELPNNQEEATETKGETFILNLAQSKVTLDGNTYQFEGNETIVAKAQSGPVAILRNSPGAEYTFTGVFVDPLGAESDSFDFYFNCADENGNEKYVQNGQPWLLCKGVPADRAKEGENAYSITQGVVLDQPEGVLALALNSTYDCKVTLNTLTAELPNGGGKSTPEIAVAANKPSFVNITAGMTGGFYLAVQKTDGTVGTMYTSYGTASPETGIEVNTPVTIKAFAPLSITGSLVDTQDTFKTSYSVYTKDGATAANAFNADLIGEGSANFSMTGISKSLKQLISLKSLTVTFSDNITATVTSTTTAWAYDSTNKIHSCSFTVPQSSGHNTWGPVTVTNVSAVFSTPDGTDLCVDFAPGITRHITGLPYNKDNAYITNFASDWVPSGGKSEYSGNYLRYGNCTVSFKGFYIPTDIKTVVSYYISGYVSTRLNPITTVFNIAGYDVINDEKKGTAKNFSYKTTRNVTFTNTKNTMYAKADCNTPSTWAQSFDELRYVGVVYDSAQ